MKFNKILILIFFIFSILPLVSLLSQNTLYMPLEFQNAYDEGTRSFDGRPGVNYWQNYSDYNINANIDIPSRTISADETIIYYNNSPDVLDKIVIRMYQNISRVTNQRDFEVSENYFTKGIVIKSMSINGTKLSLKDTLIDDTGTNIVVRGQKILPVTRTVLKISWEFEVPKENRIRMGAYDSTVFFIAYWYPQIAVYDDINGWDLVEYTGNTEFYNDFNNFDVNITVPNSIGVWATGELQNADNVFTSEFYSRYDKALRSDKIINIISNTDYSDNKTIFSRNNKTNSWHFKASNISDFTFGLSDHYIWDGRKVFDGLKDVFISAVYNPKAAQFYDVCDVVSRTIAMMTHNLPGIPFPFPKITVFNGRGGMESPMMVNMGANSEHIWMVHTVVHEVVHSYFPFYTGLNERSYAWMDEGLTQMISEYIQYDIDTTIDFRKRNIKRYLDNAGGFEDVPMMYPSYIIGGDAYVSASYFRPAAAFNILQDIFDSRERGLFKSALQEFISRWNGKHPMPYDFFFTFDNIANDTLDWFWVPWFFEQGYPDLELDSVVIVNDTLKILIDKEGTLPVPIMLEVKASDGSVMNIYKPADIWKSGIDELWLEETTDGKKIKKVTLGSPFIPDTDTTNNVWNFK